MGSQLTGIRSIAATVCRAISPLGHQVARAVAAGLTRAAATTRRMAELPELAPVVAAKKGSGSDDGGDGDGAVSLPEPPRKTVPYWFGTDGKKTRERDMTPAELAEWLRSQVEQAEREDAADAYMIALLRWLADAERERADEAERDAEGKLARSAERNGKSAEQNVVLRQKLSILKRENADLRDRLEAATAKIDELTDDDVEREPLDVYVDEDDVEREPDDRECGPQL